MKTTIITAALFLSLSFFSSGIFSQSLIQSLINDKLSLSENKPHSLVIEDKIVNKSNLNIPLERKNLLSDFKQGKPDFSTKYETTAPKKKKSIGLGVLL